jgi:hypothetical protein
MIHDGESAIVYETGNRVTDISRLGEAFEDLVEETEGSAVFRPATVEWLDKFLRGDLQPERFRGGWKQPPPEVIGDLKEFKLREICTLYRGVYWPEVADMLDALNLEETPKVGDIITY